jgi:hypothetical protein
MMDGYPAEPQKLGEFIKRNLLQVVYDREDEVYAAKKIDGRIKISQEVYLEFPARSNFTPEALAHKRTLYKDEATFKEHVRKELYPCLLSHVAGTAKVTEAEIVEMNACKECGESRIANCKSFLGMAVARAAAENYK